LNFDAYLYYDEGSPSCLRWGVNIYCGKGLTTLKVAAGTAAGTLRSDGYYTVKVAGVVYQAHRVVWELFNASPGENDVDHLDGNPSNNRLGNLRCVTHRVNKRNSKQHSSNTSGTTGVQLCANSAGCQYWRASWYSLSGKRKSKNFAIKRRGEREAFRLACECRDRMIEELNLRGAGYTETHGK
jgi:hypothetical protein